MHSIAVLALAIVGITLLALDRVIRKEQLVRLDDALKRFVLGFRPLSGSPYFMALAMVGLLLVVKVVEPQIRGMALADPVGAAENDASLYFFDNWKWLVPLILFLECFGIGLRKWFKELRRPVLCWKALGFSLLMSLFMPLYFTLSGLVGLVHIGLLPMIYPLKGILVLNERWFNSFSGVIGLVAALVATVLQFVLS